MPLSLGAYDGVKLGLCSGTDKVGIEVVEDEETSEGWADIIDIVGLDVGAEAVASVLSFTAVTFKFAGLTRATFSLGAYDGVKLGLCSGADEVGIDEVGLAVVGWLDVLGAADDDPADVGLSDRIIVGALVC